ncbi:MAG: ABC transporter ATP-binding protein [Trueperaceae bacterium]|nr:ABC transporter ATP-binding protein [Trueperaceae bacterium]
MLAAVDLVRTYATPAGDVEALRGVSHLFESGLVTAVMGPSGSGKSTLLNLLAGFDRPTSGQVTLGDEPLGALPERELAKLRLHRFGFVFQASNLISVLPARSNVAFPMGLAGVDRARREARAIALLDRFGVAHRAAALPSRLSGGERQRVALARALANDPDVVFADEPTGNLDRSSGAQVVAALQEVAAEGRTVVVVTHDPEVAAAAHVRLRLVDGRLADEPSTDPRPASTSAGPTTGPATDLATAAGRSS